MCENDESGFTTATSSLGTSLVEAQTVQKRWSQYAQKPVKKGDAVGFVVEVKLWTLANVEREI